MGIEVQKIKVLASKRERIGKSGGRNHHGRITCRHRGGGHKQLYRVVDFLRPSSHAIVENIEYDPNRTALLARLYDSVAKTHSYILAPKGLRPGHIVCSGAFGRVQTGDVLPLHAVPTGSFVHNLPCRLGQKGQLLRAGGSRGQVITENDGQVRLRIGKYKYMVLSGQARVTLGVVSNDDHCRQSLGKAGANRWRHRRPRVRGVAMNPVDHPHGGGEGKTSGGRPSVTPWGKPTKGQPTKRKK